MKTKRDGRADADANEKKKNKPFSYLLRKPYW